MHQIDALQEVDSNTCYCWIFFFRNRSKHSYYDTQFVKNVWRHFLTGTLNVNNQAANHAVVNYSSNIDHVTESSSYGDLLITDEV